MSTTAKIYIAAVLALGAGCFAAGVQNWSSGDLPRFAAYLLLAIPASCLKVPLPGITGTMSVLFLFLLAGTVELGLGETIVIGAASVVVQSFWQARVRPRLVQIAFSVANIAIAVTAGYLVYHSVPKWAPMLGTPFLLALAATVFFVMNTFPIAAVIALTEAKSVGGVWRKCYSWSFPYYLVGAAIVGMFKFANRAMDWQAWVLILPVVYIIYRSYRLYLGQLETERRHAAEQERHAHDEAELRRQAVEALASAREATAKLDGVISGSPLAIMAVDRNGAITSWNSMAERIFRISREEALGCPVCWSSEDAGSVNTAIRSSIDQGESVSAVEIAHVRPDGSCIDISVWTAPLRDSTGNVLGAVITVADISGRKALEEQLRVSQKMEAVGQLAGGIAHDFNNLLTVINGYSALLERSLTDSPAQRQQAQEILSAGMRASDLVSKLLTFSRRQIFRPTLIEINQLVSGIRQMLRQLIGEHIELRTRLSADPIWILADANQIETALMNLVTNARDAMTQGGTVCIETKLVAIGADPDPQNPSLPPGSYLSLVVSDTGHGIDAATLEHIFEPFFTTKQVGKGTGLGLSSVYATVEQSSGHISVTSHVGKGTSFAIYLPVMEEPERVSAHQRPEQDHRDGCGTVLLVEDELAVRVMLREALVSAGYRVREAGNGAQALERWAGRASEIDVVVTDVVMPVMNGLKLAAEFRAREPEIGVLLISGHSEKLISRQGGHVAGFELLAKPFLPETLVGKIGTMLNEMRERDRSRKAAITSGRLVVLRAPRAM